MDFDESRKYRNKKSGVWKEGWALFQKMMTHFEVHDNCMIVASLPFKKCFLQWPIICCSWCKMVQTFHKVKVSRNESILRLILKMSWKYPHVHWLRTGTLSVTTVDQLLPNVTNPTTVYTALVFLHVHLHLIFKSLTEPRPTFPSCSWKPCRKIRATSSRKQEVTSILWWFRSDKCKCNIS